MATRIRDQQKAWSREAAYRRACAALADEFDLAAAVIEARMRAGLLSQAAPPAPTRS